MSEYQIYSSTQVTYTLTNSIEGTITIAEPIGWDAFEVSLVRDLQYWGIVRETSTGEDKVSLKFGKVKRVGFDSSYNFVKNISKTQGQSADLRLTVLSDGAVLYVFELDLKTYEVGRDFVEVAGFIQVINEDFYTYFDKKIDVTQSESVRGGAITPPVKNDITLMSQIIKKQSVLNYDVPELPNFNIAAWSGSSSDKGYWSIVSSPNNVVTSQILDTFVTYPSTITPTAEVTVETPESIVPTIVMEESGTLLRIKVNTKIRLRAQYTRVITGSGVPTEVREPFANVTNGAVNLVISIKRGDTYDVIRNTPFVTAASGIYEASDDSSIYEFSEDIDLDYGILRGDQVHVEIKAFYQMSGVGFTFVNSAIQVKPDIPTDPEWIFELDSKTIQTPSKSMSVRRGLEAISRSIFGSNIISYGDVFSPEYTIDRQHILSGFDVRGKFDEKMEYSMKDLVDLMKLTTNTGIGLKLNGSILLATFDEFFNERELLDISDNSVDEYSENASQEFTKGLLNYGFSKFTRNDITSEGQYNSLDGFHTLHVRNTPQNKGNEDELTINTGVIADGYTLEFTRRKSPVIIPEDTNDTNDTNLFLVHVDFSNQIISPQGTYIREVRLSNGLSGTFNAAINFLDDIFYNEVSVGNTIRVDTSGGDFLELTVGGIEVQQDISRINYLGTEITSSGSFFLDDFTDYTFTNISKSFFTPKRDEDLTTANILFPDSTYNLLYNPIQLLVNSSGQFSGSSDLTLSKEYRFLSGENNNEATINGLQQNQLLLDTDLLESKFSETESTFTIELGFDQLQTLREGHYGETDQAYGYLTYLDEEGNKQIGWVKSVNYSLYSNKATITVINSSKFIIDDLVEVTAAFNINLSTKSIGRNLQVGDTVEIQGSSDYAGVYTLTASTTEADTTIFTTGSPSATDNGFQQAIIKI